jgi:cytokinesis protein
MGGPAAPPAMAGLLAGIRGGIKLNKTDGPRAPPPPPAPPMAPPMSGIARAPTAPLGALLYGANDMRKDGLTASKKMKTVQLDKVPQRMLNRTLWSEAGKTETEDELVSRMKLCNVWDAMESKFQAFDRIQDAVKKKKQEELLSVLPADRRKRIEILMAAAKSFQDPETLSEAIVNFDSGLCTETFLHELGGVLPNADERGKLLTHSADTPAELDLLHPADRLMVRLIQVPHLHDRVHGMLFQVRFDANVKLMKTSLDLLVRGCHALRDAPFFQRLLQLVLNMANFLNGSNFAGGAYGFNIASINKLVDTKSSSGLTLLSFLEKTVRTHFQELEGFLDELAAPSAANRVNFMEIQNDSTKQLEDIRRIRASLKKNFQEVNDKYAQKMFSFSATAEKDIETLRDRIINAGALLRDVQTYYGEGEEHARTIQSQDFFSIFATFTSSYKISREQNRKREEEEALRERRAAERQHFKAQQTTAAAETDLIDARLQRLKLEGTPRIKRERRQPAPSLEALPANADLSDFMLPRDMSDVTDFGSLAQQMMANIAPGGSVADVLGPAAEGNSLTPARQRRKREPFNPSMDFDLVVPSLDKDEVEDGDDAREDLESEVEAGDEDDDGSNAGRRASLLSRSKRSSTGSRRSAVLSRRMTRDSASGSSISSQSQHSHSQSTSSLLSEGDANRRSPSFVSAKSYTDPRDDTPPAQSDAEDKAGVDDDKADVRSPSPIKSISSIKSATSAAFAPSQHASLFPPSDEEEGEGEATVVLTKSPVLE